MCRYRAWIVLGLAAGMCACAGEARAQGSIAGDRAALEAFYHALDGPWRGTENWASEAPLGEWDGVTTDESGRVTEVDLSVDEPDTFAAFPRLRGPIPPELGNLTMLRKLDLGANRLRASIPAELAKLTKLEKLILGGERSGSSELEGPVPAWLGDLTQLKVLHLGGNDLSGPIPAELGDLTQLEVLHLGGNDLSGPIPAELGDLTQLEVLHLGGNDLSGSVPAELGQLTGLRSLRLYGNRLDGSIPASLGNLVNLEVIGVNDLSGAPRPGDAARLANLELLHSGRGRLRDATEVGIERFAGEAGQLIAVSVRSQGFDARIKILSPVGERLASAGAFADEFRVAWLPGNGEYRIEVASPMVRAGLERGCCSVSCGPSPRCDYEVDVRVVPVELLTLGTPVDPFLAAGMGVRAWRFRGTAGQVVNVDARLPFKLFTGFPSLVLLSRAGEQLGWESNNLYDLLRLSDAVLPRTEDYVLIYAYTHTLESRAVRLAVSASTPEPIR